MILRITGLLLSPCVIHRLVLLMTTRCVPPVTRTIHFQTKSTVLIALQRQCHVPAVVRRASAVESCFLSQDTARDIRGRKIRTGWAFHWTLWFSTVNIMCRDGSVGIPIGYGLDYPGIESWRGWNFPQLARPFPGKPSNILCNGYRVFPGGKVRPGRVAKTSHLLVPWSRKSRAILLIPLWTVRSLKSLSACRTVHFTFTYTSIPPMDRTACTEPQFLYNGTLYLYLYFYSPYGPYWLYRASVPVQGCTLPFYLTRFITISASVRHLFLSWDGSL